MYCLASRSRPRAPRERGYDVRRVRACSGSRRLRPALTRSPRTSRALSPQKFSDVAGRPSARSSGSSSALSLAGVAETVSVTAESPLIDVRNNARRPEHQRRLQSICCPTAATSRRSSRRPPAPTRRAEARRPLDRRRDRRARTATSSTASRRPTSDRHLGQASVLTDFVEEVQVKSSGYQAEFGGATGGVVNVVTKSGTNNLHGTRHVQHPGLGDGSSRRPTLRLKLDGLERSRSTSRYPEDDSTRIEPVFAARRPDSPTRRGSTAAISPR